MIKFFRRLLRDRRGNALVVAGAALPMVIGSAGLASDTIQWVLWKRQLQRLADSGAIAGAYARAAGKGVGACSSANIPTATFSDPVAYDIRTNNRIGTVPECNAGTTTWPNSTNAVNVVLTMQRQLSFSGFFLSSPPTIRATATAATVPTGVYCVVSLEKTSATGITSTGNSTLNLGCGMITNSTSTNAAIATGSTTVTASPIAAVGDIQENAKWGGAELLPFTVAQADPFAGVNVPSFSGCQSSGVSLSPNPGETVDRSSDTGIQCITGINSKGTLKLGSATYIVDGGSVFANAGGTITCSGCTIVLTNSNSSPTATIGTVDLTGGGKLTMTAPDDASNPFDGILFYQDRRASSTGTNKINGNTGSTFSGAMYFPNQLLDVNGTATLNFTCGQFVAKNVEFSGNGVINNTCTGGYGSSTIMGQHVRLVA